jgi:ElaB/YqjD/DUF883 family membrane-anchored ribosome-binding protein
MTSHNVESEFDTFKDDLAKLRADVANLSAALRDVTSDTVHEQVDAIRGRINRLTDSAKIEGQQRLDELTEQIEERPLTSVLIAFGVGLLIGRLFDR